MGMTELDRLRPIENKQCEKCDKKKRIINTENHICKITKSKMDGLPIRCVGQWAYKKIYWLTHYFYIFATGMHNKWPEKLNYIEICSGPGRCITKNNGIEIDGTALAILNNDAYKHINKVVFIDNDNKVIETLNKRIISIDNTGKAKAVWGDYSKITKIKNILNNLPKRCLNLVFIDPTDASVPFSTIKAIKETLGKMDLIINFASGTDIFRNIKNVIVNTKYNLLKEKYIEFLGSNEFFDRTDIIQLANEGNTDKLMNEFIKEYKKSLSIIGLGNLDMVSIGYKNHIFYHLLFATGHKTGMKFWYEIQGIGPNGQRNFKFGE